MLLRSVFGKGAVFQGPVKIELSRDVRVFLGDDEFVLTGMKVRALLAIVALACPKPVSRDSLSALLWSERDQSTARAALRQTLRRLRSGLSVSAEQLLDVKPESIALRQNTARIDVIEALSAARAGQCPNLLTEDPSAFINTLTGLDHVDANFANWLAVFRQKLQQDAVDAIGLELGDAANPSKSEIAKAQLLLQMEPTHERACRLLMRHYHATGQPAKALEVYARLWDALDEDFDILPSDETQSLVVEIKQSGCLNEFTHLPPAISDAHHSGSPASIDDTVATISSPVAIPVARLEFDNPPIIRVEDFDETGVDANQALRLQGLRLDFIAALCRFREWRVVDGPTPLPSDLNVTTEIVLSGWASESDAGCEVILTLQNRRTSEIIWSERVRLGATEIHRAQLRSIRRIAIALNVHLCSTRLARTPRSEDNELSASDAWLLGQALLTHWQPDSERRAEQLFREMVAKRPNFAPAYVGLAQVLNTRHFIQPGVSRSTKTHREALGLCIRAVSMDPLDSKAQLTLAWSFTLNAAWESAIEVFRLACELNENDAWTLISSSLGLSYCGCVREALSLSDQMLDLGLGVTPLHWGYNAGVRFISGDYASAAMSAARASGTSSYVRAWHVGALAFNGLIDEAKAVLDEFYDYTAAHWVGGDAGGKPDPAEMTRWLLHLYPIRSDDVWERLRVGLATAGAPVPERRPDVQL